ncbi:MAG: HigA family addiction module antitoxin [Actinomycetota bacterium]|jgi:addiction module HigA family antidote
MKNPVHPGEILREDVIVELDLTVGEVAEALGISRVALSRVLHEHTRVTPNVALRLEAAGIGTARAWLAMQTAYDLAEARAGADFKVRKLNPVA